MSRVLGRSEEPSAWDTSPSKRLGKRLLSAGEKRFTGVFRVSLKGTGAESRLYMHEGGLYAAHLDGYSPVLMDRLLSAGGLDTDRWNALASIYGAHQSDPRVGVTAVEQDWLSVDDLCNRHQEYFLAGLGAVLVQQKVKVDEEADVVTAHFCSLPQEVPRLLRMVDSRANSLASNWKALGAQVPPDALVLARTGNRIPESLSAAEFGAIVDAVDGEKSLDEVAELLGLTRAEAVRYAGLLVLANTINAVQTGSSERPRDRLLVPEAFGQVTVDTSHPRVTPSRDVRPAVVVVPEPETVPVVVVPEPEPEPELVPVVVVPEPETVPVVVVPEPEPEPVVVVPEPEPELVPVVVVPEPEPEPVPVVVVPEARTPAGHRQPAIVKDHVRQLRLEVATTEAAELEELLQESIAAEHEALIRTAVIRQRLREALDTMAELSASEGLASQAVDDAARSAGGKG